MLSMVNTHTRVKGRRRKLPLRFESWSPDWSGHALLHANANDTEIVAPSLALCQA